ncbi:MAG: DUF2484 family protein [Pseudomonadota bacterium]
MNWAIVGSCVWVLCATVTALLPMRLQYVPGVTLLVLAPVFLIWLGLSVGWGWALAGVLGFVSMFRNPLRYFWARARGERPELPR